jgi:hypothetical protein
MYTRKLIQYCHGESNTQQKTNNELDLNSMKKIVKGYIWSTAFYDAETWTHQKADEKHLKVLKSATGEGWRRSV